ncbi:hypothetical protein Pfo_000308 [Paulownia fortunei]|nr:hypothetical protein Pfo_000308 [Paulownia fortunei]
MGINLQLTCKVGDENEFYPPNLGWKCLVSNARDNRSYWYDQLPSKNISISVQISFVTNLKFIQLIHFYSPGYQSSSHPSAKSLKDSLINRKAVTYDSPVAKLRDDLFVTLLDAGEDEIAHAGILGMHMKLQFIISEEVLHRSPMIATDRSQGASSSPVKHGVGTESPQNQGSLEKLPSSVRKVISAFENSLELKGTVNMDTKQEVEFLKKCHQYNVKLGKEGLLETLKELESSVTPIPSRGKASNVQVSTAAPREPIVKEWEISPVDIMRQSGLATNSGRMHEEQSQIVQAYNFSSKQLNDSDSSLQKEKKGEENA